jgi:hypothetical protein
MTEFTLIQLVPELSTYAAQSRRWYLYANDQRLFEWQIAWPESRSVVYSRPAWEFAPFFTERAKLETTIDLNGVMHILKNLRVPEDQIKTFMLSLANGGHMKKLFKWYNENQNAVSQHPASS